MKISCLLVLLFLAMIVHGQAAFEKIPFADWKGKSLPDQEWLTLNGDTLNQSFFKGKVCFFNFFMAGCPPCMQEIRYLNKLYNHYSDSTDVCIVGVFSGDRDEFLKYYKFEESTYKASSNSTLKLKYSRVSIPKYTILLIDFNHFKFKYHAWGVPSNLIMDKNGIIQVCKSGFPMELSAQEKYYLEYISEIQELRK